MRNIANLVADAGEADAPAAAPSPQDSAPVNKIAEGNGGNHAGAPPPDSDIVSTAVVCQRLDKSRGTIDEWRKAGLLPYMKVGRSVMFSWASVLEALRRQERRTA